MNVLGANQFNKEERNNMDKYFSVHYLSISIASSASSFIFPMIRNDIKCFGEDCYPLAFGLSSTFMFIGKYTEKWNLKKIILSKITIEKWELTNLTNKH